MFKISSSSFSKKDAIATLIKLGLSAGEAKTYVSLVTMDTLFASEIARAAEVPQPKVYGFLKSLEEKNFITRQEKSGRPDTFTATAFDIVVEKLTTDMEEMIANTKDYLEEANKAKATEQVRDLFAYYEGENAVISGLDVIISRMQRNAIFLFMNKKDKKHIENLLERKMKENKDIKIYTISIPKKLQLLPLFRNLAKSEKFKNYSENQLTAFFTDIDLENLTGKSLNIVFPAIEEYSRILINIKHPTALIFQLQLYDIFEKQIGLGLKEGLV